MASQVRKKKWDAETGTFVDDNDGDSRQPQQHQQSNRKPKNQNQGNQQGRKESKGQNVQRGNSASNDNQGNTRGRNDRRGQARQDGPGFDDRRGHRSGPPPGAYGPPPNYPPHSAYNYPPNHRPQPPMMQYPQHPYGVAAPIVQPVIYQPMMPPHMPMPNHHPNQQGYYPPPIGSPMPPQYGGPPPPYSQSGGRDSGMEYQDDRNNSKNSRQDGRQQKQDGRQQKKDGRQQQQQQDGKQQKQDRRQQKQESRQQKQDGRQQEQDGRQQKHDGRQQKQDDQQKHQDGQHKQNKGRGGNDNNRQRYSSSRSNDSMGTDNGEENMPQNNRGRGKEGQRQRRGKGGNSGSVQRSPSPASVCSDDSTSNDGRQESNKRNNRGRGRDRGKQFGNRGRGRPDGQQFDNRGRGRPDGQQFDNRGRGRPDGQQFDNRGRGRPDGQQFDNRGRGRSDGQQFDYRGRGRSDGQQFGNRGRGRGDGVPYDNRAPRNTRGRGQQDGGGYRGRGGNNRASGRGGYQQRFQGNRRGFRPPFWRGVGNRGRGSVADSGEYSDCSASVVSGDEFDDSHEMFHNKPDFYRRGRGGIGPMHDGRIYFPRGPRRGGNRNRNLESLLQMLPQRDPIKSWNGPRRGRFAGRWSGLAARRGNMRNRNDSSDDVDDSISLVSEVSEFHDEPESDNKKGNKKEIEEIKLDDLFTISLITLKNRLKRHKKKLADMKKNKENQKAIEVYEMKVKLVANAKAKREKTEKPEPDLTKKGKMGAEKIESVEDDDTSSDDTIYEEPAVSRRNVNTAAKRSHVIGTAKGRVSYQPKKNKKGKVGAKKTPKPLVGACKVDSEEVSDSSEGYVEEEEVVCRPKQTVSKKKPTEKKKHKVSTGEDDSEVLEDVTEEGSSEEEEKVTKKVNKRSRNRKKQGKTTSSSDIANESITGSTDKQLLTDILGKLDNIISNEKREKPVHTKDSSPGTSDHVDKSDGNDKDSKKQQKKTKNSKEKDGRKVEKDLQKEEKKGEKDLQKEERKVAKDLQKEGRKGGKDFPKERKVSEGADPDVNEVFKFIVKNLEGKGTPEEIVRESDLFPINFDAIKWFSRLRSRFNLLERNGSIELVFVFNRDASYCLDYIKNKSCDKPACTRYHVCKNMLSGHCMYGPEKCKYSHDLLDERNMKISKELGFNNVFTNEEICSILKVRFPHICTSWMETGACLEIGCYALHMCPRFVFGKCLEGNSCQLNHDRASEHNTPIINAYNMSKWNEGLFRKMVYMVRKGATDESVPEPVEDVEGATGGKPKATRGKQKTSISEDSENAADSSVCMNHLIGNCKSQKCKYIHSNMKLPYIWQIQLYGTWVTVDDSEEVEKCFSEKNDFSNMFQLLHNEMEFGARIFFKPSIRGVANIAQPDSDQMSVEARRLSTVSYKQSSVQNTFLTQWRWYWLDNDYQWQLFQPDVMQHTLETKFLAKQREYNFSREDYKFKYKISFDAMTQTNLEIGTSRDMIRRPLFVSFHDVQEIRFAESLPVAPEIRVPLPENWAPWDLVNPFELVRLSEVDLSYKNVRADFYKTLNPSQQKITDIFRVQNHKLWTLFKNQEEYMQSNYQRVGKNMSVDIRHLYHGTTSLNAVRGISINNFDIRVSGTHGTLYGDGAYFARDAKYSHNYTNGPQRLMFVASVLVGQFTKGDKSLRRPPEIPGSQHELYDSCVDNVDDPKIFVLFDKNQFYPGYLIQYQDLDAHGPGLHPAPPPGRGPGLHLAPAQGRGPGLQPAPAQGRGPAQPPAQPDPPSPPAGINRSSQRGASFQPSTPEPPKKKDDSCSIQ